MFAEYITCTCIPIYHLPDSPQHHPAPATPRISLLELMQSEAGDNSAESTAQHLLQHVAGQLTGSMSGEFNLSQTVRREGEVVEEETGRDEDEG